MRFGNPSMRVTVEHAKKMMSVAIKPGLCPGVFSRLHRGSG